MRQAEQAIGLTRHRAHDQYDLVSLSLRAQRKLGNVSHTVEIGDRSTTEFLNDESHAASLVAPKTEGVKSEKRCYCPGRDVAACALRRGNARHAARDRGARGGGADRRKACRDGTFGGSAGAGWATTARRAARGVSGARGQRRVRGWGERGGHRQAG